MGIDSSEIDEVSAKSSHLAHPKQQQHHLRSGGGGGSGLNLLLGNASGASPSTGPTTCATAGISSATTALLGVGISAGSPGGGYPASSGSTSGFFSATSGASPCAGGSSPGCSGDSRHPPNNQAFLGDASGGTSAVAAASVLAGATNTTGATSAPGTTGNNTKKEEKRGALSLKPSAFHPYLVVPSFQPLRVSPGLFTHWGSQSQQQLLQCNKHCGWTVRFCSHFPLKQQH